MALGPDEPPDPAADGPLVRRYLQLRPVATLPDHLLRHTSQTCWPVAG